MVSSKCNSILRRFQSTMVPFIADSLGDLFRDFFGRIISKDVLKKKLNLHSLMEIAPLDKKIGKNPESAVIGFAAKHKLEQIKSSLNSANIFEFKKQTGEFLAQLLHYFLEKSPLKYAVACSAVCLNPMYMRNPAKKSSYESYMDILLQKLVCLGRTSARSAELVKKQYRKFFIVVDQNQQLFSSFNPKNDRVDTFFSELMGSSDEYGNLWEFYKMFLILFYGQSEDERGFRVNKQLLVENLKTKSLVALRRIEDYMNFSELSPETIKIFNELIKNFKEAHRCYQDQPDKQRKQKQEYKNH